MTAEPQADPQDVGAGASSRVEATEAAGATRTQQFGAAGHEQVIDVGMDESIMAHIAQGVAQSGFDEGLRRTNAKRTADQYQSLDLVSLGNIQGHAQNVANIATQALQNAVETANMVSKQAVRHGDIATDHIWNVESLAQTITDSVVSAVLARLGNAPGATGQTGPSGVEPK